MNISLSDWEVDALLHYITNFSLPKITIMQIPCFEKESNANPNMSTIYQSTQINTNDLPSTRKGSKSTKQYISNNNSSQIRKKHEKSLSALNNQDTIRNKLGFKKCPDNQDNAYFRDNINSEPNKLKKCNNLSKDKSAKVLPSVSSKNLTSSENNIASSLYLNILKELKIWNIYINGEKVDLNLCIDQNRIILANDQVEFRYERFLKIIDNDE